MRRLALQLLAVSLLASACREAAVDIEFAAQAPMQVASLVAEAKTDGVVVWSGSFGLDGGRVNLPTTLRLLVSGAQFEVTGAATGLDGQRLGGKSSLEISAGVVPLRVLLQVLDAGAVDAGVDAGAVDAGTPDAGAPDAGAADAGLDAGAVDAGPTDAGVPDAGAPDAGARDAGPADAGQFDAGVAACPAPALLANEVRLYDEGTQNGWGAFGYDPHLAEGTDGGGSCTGARWLEYVVGRNFDGIVFINGVDAGATRVSLSVWVDKPVSGLVGVKAATPGSSLANWLPDDAGCAVNRAPCQIVFAPGWQRVSLPVPLGLQFPVQGVSIELDTTAMQRPVMLRVDDVRITR